MINLFEITERSTQQFCVLPFIGLHVDSDRNFVPCCKIQKLRDVPVCDSPQEALEFYRKSEHLQEIRQSFLDGDIPNTCKKCFSGGGRSYPFLKNKEYLELEAQNGNKNSIIPITGKIITFNFVLLNTCNLRCRMCAPALSSSIAKIWDKELENLLNVPNHQNFNHQGFLQGLLSSPELATVNYVALGGGEVLLNHNFKELFTEIAEKLALVKFQIISNLSIDKFETIDFFGNFPDIQIMFTVSVDGGREVQSYVRNLINLPVFESNIERLKRFKNLKVAVFPTISMFNVFDVENLITYSYELFDDDFGIGPNIVGQNFLHVKNLPRKLKEEAIISISKAVESVKTKYSAKQNFDKAVSFLENVKQLVLNHMDYVNPAEYKLFVDYTRKLDTLYGTNFLDVAPHFSPFFTEEYLLQNDLSKPM